MARVDEAAHVLYEQFRTNINDLHKHGWLDKEVRDCGFEPSCVRARGKEDHRHWKDPEFGVSPHTLKFGKIGDASKLLMGRCSVTIKEM